MFRESRDQEVAQLLSTIGLIGTEHTEHPEHTTFHYYIVMTRSIVTEVLSDLCSQFRTRIRSIHSYDISEEVHTTASAPNQETLPWT
jgi:hypothetical protein